MNKLNSLRVLRSPDADPLSEAAGGVNTDFPVLADKQLLRCVCREASVAPTKKNPNASMLTIRLETKTDAYTTDGQVQPAGFPLYDRCMITPTEKRSIEAIKKDLALRLKAFGMADKSLAVLRDTPEVLKDQVVDIKTTVEPESDGFPARNGMRFQIPA